MFEVACLDKTFSLTWYIHWTQGSSVSGPRDVVLGGPDAQLAIAISTPALDATPSHDNTGVASVRGVTSSVDRHGRDA
jgi:hypothetical protein